VINSEHGDEADVREGGFPAGDDHDPLGSPSEVRLVEIDHHVGKGDDPVQESRRQAGFGDSLGHRVGCCWMNILSIWQVCRISPSCGVLVPGCTLERLSIPSIDASLFPRSSRDPQSLLGGRWTPASSFLCPAPRPLVSFARKGRGDRRGDEVEFSPSRVQRSGGALLACQRPSVRKEC